MEDLFGTRTSFEGRGSLLVPRVQILLLVLPGPGIFGWGQWSWFPSQLCVHSG